MASKNPPKSLDGSASINHHHFFAYSLVGMGFSTINVPLNSLIPAFYAENTQASMAAIGVALIVGRLFDAVTDPLVGYFSDRTKSRFGPRKPWIAAGAVLSCIGLFLLYNPGPSANAFQYGAVLLFVYLGLTMSMIPRLAWGSEITRVYKHRSILSGYTETMAVFGLLIFMGAPILFSSPIFPLFESSEFTPDMLRFVGWISLGLVVVTTAYGLAFAPKGDPVARKKTTIVGVFKSLRRNGPAQIFFGATMMVGLGYGVYYASSYLFIAHYLKIPEYFPHYFAFSAVVQIITFPLWARVMNSVDRHKLWAAGMVGFGLMLLPRMFLPAGPEAFIPLLALSLFSSSFIAASQIGPPPVLADCVDYDIMKTGVNRAGNYYSFQYFSMKAMSAIGGGLGFFLLSAFQFDAKSEVFSKSALQGLAVTHALVPCLFFFLCGAILMRYPLTRKKQRTVRRYLARRVEREARAAD